MFMFTTENTAVRELDHRTSDGIDVRLWWSEPTNHVFLTLEDLRSGELYELVVPGADAFDAFHHPYAYLFPTVSTGTE
jgi:hypothetical protein